MIHDINGKPVLREEPGGTLCHCGPDGVDIPGNMIEVYACIHTFFGKSLVICIKSLHRLYEGVSQTGLIAYFFIDQVDLFRDEGYLSANGVHAFYTVMDFIIAALQTCGGRLYGIHQGLNAGHQLTHIADNVVGRGGCVCGKILHLAGHHGKASA